MRDVRQALVPGVFFGLNLADLLRRGDAQQRRQRRADRFARAVPHRADRARGCSRSTSIRGRWCSRSSRSAVSAIVLFSAPPNGDASLRGQRVRPARDAACWWPTSSSTRHFRRDMDVATFMATISPIAAVAVLPAGDRQRRRVRDERHGMDVHADPHVPHRGRRPRADGVRAEDDPDRHDRDRPGGAARPRGRVVVPAAGRDAAALAVVGIAIVVGGLLAFIVAEPARRPVAGAEERRDISLAAEGPGAAV